MSNLIGQTIGQYQIVEQLGRGGMATVFKAFQPSMERYVAIKVLPEQFAEDPTFVERFRREAKAIAQLEHPHILPVFDYGEHDGLTYMVMRCLESGTLADRLKQGLDVTEAVRFLIQVAEALDYTHRQGIIHRDIKPSNILIDPHGQALLTDFGIAKAVEGVQGLTAGGIIGTPEYMSPEQAQGQPVDGRSDIYSLGVILYQVMVGRPPFEAETPVAVLMKHVNATLSIPRQINPDVSEAMEQVILKALAKDPADRYQTAREMGEAMQAALLTTGQSPTQFSAMPAPTPSGIPLAVQPEPRQTRRWPIVAVVGIVLLLICGIIAVGGGAFWWFSDTDAVSEESETVAEVVKTIEVTEEEGEAVETKNTPIPIVVATPVDTTTPTETPAPTEPPLEEEPTKVEPTEPVLPNEPTEVESGSSLEAAAELEMGLYNSSLTAEAEDWYKVEIPHAYIMNLAFTPAENAKDQHVQLFNPNHQQVWQANYVGALQTAAVTGVMNNITGGTYYVKIAGGPGDYTLALTLQSQNDANLGGDAGDEIGQALEVQLEQIFSGQIGDFDKKDFYKFEIPHGHIFNLAFTATESTSNDLDIYLFDPEQTEIWRSLSVGPTVTESTAKMMNSSSGGTYYVKVSGGMGSYNLDLSLQSQNDADVGSDAGDEIGQALGILMKEAGQIFSGQIGDFDKKDFYKFEIPHGHIFNLAFTAAESTSNDLDIYLFDPEQTEIWRSLSVGPTVTESTAKMMNSSSGGTYYVKVSGGTGSYNLDLSLQSQNDADSSNDGGDEAIAAVPIVPGEEGVTFSGQIGDFDKMDWYKVDIPNGYILSVAFTSAEDNTKEQAVYVFNPGQQEIWRAWNIGPSMTMERALLMNNSSGGAYYVQASGGAGNYDIDLSVQNQNDANSSGDAPDELVEALEVKAGQALTGQIGHFDEEDWYQFTPKEGQVISFTPGKDTESTLHIRLFDPEQKRIWNETYVKPTLTKSFELSEVVEETYYVQVAAEDYGSYTLEIK